MSVLVSYRTDEGTRTALLVGEGRKYLRVLTMECPMRVVKVPLKEGRFMRVLDYPIQKALRTYRRVARRDYGTLRGSPAAVREALN